MYQGRFDEYITDIGDITYVQDCFKQKGRLWVDPRITKVK